MLLNVENDPKGRAAKNVVECCQFTRREGQPMLNVKNDLKGRAAKIFVECCQLKPKGRQLKILLNVEN